MQCITLHKKLFIELTSFFSNLKKSLKFICLINIIFAFQHPSKTEISSVFKGEVA